MKQALKLLCVPLAAAMLAAGLTLQAAIANPDRPGAKSEHQNVNLPSKNQSSITVVGVLRYLPVEGGCYQIETGSGETFEPLGDFPKQDGALVRVRGQLLTDVATICQVGQPLQVESVQVRQQQSKEKIANGELSPSLPEGVVFRAISSGGFAGLTTETTVLDNGRVNRVVSRGTTIVSQSELCQISPQQLRQFQQLVEGQRFARLNGRRFPPQPQGADIITTTFISQVGTVSFDDIARSQGLPNILQKVDRALNQLCN